MEIRFVVPVREKVSASNFEDFQEFHVIDVNENQIVKSEYVDPSPRAVEELPEWLEEELGAHVLITGRIDPGILASLNRSSINVITGAPNQEPQKLVVGFLNNSLTRMARY